MNYEWLFAFAVFAEHVNFTHAARVLGITQPALHAQVRKLREDVGVELYRRRGRGLELTPEGRRLAAFARDVRARGEDVIAELNDEDPKRPLVLAAGRGALIYMLGPAIRRFPKRRWPLRVVPMTAEQTVQALSDAQVDLGVTVLEEGVDGLERETLTSVGQVAVLPRSHRLARRRRIRPSDLDGESIVVAPEGRPHRRMLERAFALAGARFEVAVEASGWQLMLHLCRYGLGIAVVNDFCPIPRGLVGVSLSDVPETTYALLTRSGPQHPALETLRTLIAQGVTT